MNKYLILLLTLVPVLASADNSLSFSPPASDYSVIFLANIFGIVDGILHGTGSEMMGAIFSVFNAAVLALGGIVIMYTLIVSTMNTAHEGQMLGQKWSSMWVPLRATMGLALLIPKASGYCLMQIFVMWVVVQGVGAADKVWDAALSYLNGGGSLVQAQTNPTQQMTNTTGQVIPTAAQVILSGQVCMLGLQTQLQNQLQSYQKQKSLKSGPTGPCAAPLPGTPMAAFCASTVPNFINTVDVVETQSQNQSAANYTLPMPNFDASNTTYAFLNGICGHLNWNNYWNSLGGTSQAQLSQLLQNEDLKTAQMSRAIAIQQMYMDLATVAQVMIGNDPELSSSTTNSNNSANQAPPMAIQQFGVPQTPGGVQCTDMTTPNCILWGVTTSTGSGSGSTLFNGTEFLGAVQDYNGVMAPVLNAQQEALNTAAAASSRSFIQSASTQGWITAGSYFFYLVNLNVEASNNAATVLDTNTGLEGSGSDPMALTAAFSLTAGSSCPSGSNVNLCTWFGGDAGKVNSIVTLINGTGAAVTPSPLPLPSFKNSSRSVTGGVGSSTVYGFTNNATILQVPGQPGFSGPTITDNSPISVQVPWPSLPDINFPCGGTFWTGCMGQALGDFFYNDVLRFLWNTIMQGLQDLITNLINAVLILPLKGMSAIFGSGLKILSQPGANPVVALAQMGTFYINFSGDLYIMLMEAAIASVLMPLLIAPVFVLLMMTMPIFLAMVSIMVDIGFVTAYYVPMLPYMIFVFGSIAWLMAVIEAMVAAPIVALGVSHPEGEGAFGKGEQAIMILMNVFLRPAMMIIGYIAGIMLTYVSVWILNAGFNNASSFMQGQGPFAQSFNVAGITTAEGVTSGGYVGWAGLYAYFFTILIYTTMYLTVVQKSFTLISVLPDKVLRWISGGQQEQYGGESAQWGDELVKGKLASAGEKTTLGQAQVGKQMSGYGAKGASAAKDSADSSAPGKVGAEGGMAG